MTTLEKIMAEIQKVLDKERDFSTESAKAQAMALMWCLEIIDKYAEQEPCENCCNGNQIEKAKLCQKSYLAGMEHKQEQCEDAVSRQAVLDLFEDYCGVAHNYAQVWEDVEHLPSVQPKAKTGVASVGEFCHEHGLVLMSKEMADKYEGQECEDAVSRRWNNHQVACLLADMFGDNCACNYNGIDEWLPNLCDFKDTCCPKPVGVACWEQFLKHTKSRYCECGYEMR